MGQLPEQSRAERTRNRILDAAERLILERGFDGVGLEAVAEASGVSRQAIYDKFGTKSGLLLEMTRRLEARIGIPQAVGTLNGNADGETRLAALFRLNATSEPAVAPFIRVVYAARLHDATAEELWRSRMSARHAAMRGVVMQLDRERRLRPGLSIDRATDILWSLINPLHYDNLVNSRGWSGSEYAEHLETRARAALLGDTPGPWRQRQIRRWQRG